MDNRSDWVDYAKAIGIILVVYAHVARGLHSAGVNVPEDFFLLADSVVYSFVMPLFFFLSGMFFYGSFSQRGGPKLIGSKIDTIFYPYVVWSIAQGMLEVWLAPYTNGQVTYSEVFSLLWLPRAQFWFLYALFAAFLLALVIFSIFSKKASIAVFLVAAIAYVFSSTLPEVFLLSVMAHHFVFFVFGIVFSLHLKAEQLFNPLLLAVSAFAFIVGQFMFHYISGLRYENYGIASLSLALVSIMFIMQFSIWISARPNRLMVFIGLSSMAIYLMHILAGGAARVVLQAMHIDSFIIHLLLGCLAGLFVPLLTLRLISRFKIRYIFSAPISKVIRLTYHKMLRKSV